ncbi:hypothetical protein [Roseovarius pacificus]|uniref:hypothetical protein n=1 Tax=Roseovarius pacificus TaxID=337701 RepID=UPI0040396483
MARRVSPAWNWHDDGKSDYEIEGQQDLDVQQIYRDLGLGDGSHLDRGNDPVIEISEFLDDYQDRAYPTHLPKFAERHEVIKEIQKRIHALTWAFENTSEQSFFDIEDSIVRGLNQEPSAAMPSEGYVSPEINFFRECSVDYLAKFAKLMDIAAAEFANHPDAPKKGRPPKTALQELIRDLAWVYEKHTGEDAYKGLAFDGSDREFDSAFFRFVWGIISKFDPSAARTNQALGAQIRTALSAEAMENYGEEIIVYYEGDGAPGK